MDVAAGVASDVDAELPVVAGGLCAKTGAAIAADNASSAQSILLMANANALCFIFPFSLVSKTHTLLCKEKSCELLRSIYKHDAPRIARLAPYPCINAFPFKSRINDPGVHGQSGFIKKQS
ncbi:hypothetical protein [Paraburkholderia sp. GAS199]|uniref:hypothetical protein n=1 Tax=Paraburkholderia sp. GAS199 TaxID=3035126 RepID=UPI003D1F1FA9